MNKSKFTLSGTVLHIDVNWNEFKSLYSSQGFKTAHHEHREKEKWVCGGQQQKNLVSFGSSQTLSCDTRTHKSTVDTQWLFGLRKQTQFTHFLHIQSVCIIKQQIKVWQGWQKFIYINWFNMCQIWPKGPFSSAAPQQVSITHVKQNKGL